MSTLIYVTAKHVSGPAFFFFFSLLFVLMQFIYSQNEGGFLSKN